MWQSPVYNSIPVFNLRLIQYLAAHPLFNNNLVKDPITGNPVNIKAYRQKGGYSSEPGLICSIYPAFQAAESSPPSPTSTGVSTIYKEFQIGKNSMEVLYHFIVEFTLFYTVSYDQLTPISNAGLESLAKVPIESITFPNQLIRNLNTKQVDVYIDPPQLIVGTYQELAFLAFHDETYRASLNIPELRGISVLHANLPTSYKWEEGTNLFISKSSMYIRLHTYINKTWTDIFTRPIRIINTDLERINLDLGADPYDDTDTERVTVPQD